MPDQEHCAGLTRAARKRPDVAAPDSTEDQPLTKRRVVLGELPNFSNPVVPAANNTALCKKISKTKTKKAESSKANALKDNTDGDGGEDDPQMCRAYASDMYEYLHELEADPKKRPLPDYIETVQKDVNAKMRGEIVDWLVEVGEEYKLLPDTLHMTISNVDRFLSSSVLERQMLQLLGVSSMLIASKYEEISPPKVEDFCYVTDNTYTKEEVVKMEAGILKSLKFEFGGPTIRTFLRVAQEDYKLQFLGYYLAELSLLDYNCVKFLPSLVAASSIFLARFMIKPKMTPWSTSLEQCTGYNSSDLKDCVLILHDL